MPTIRFFATSCAAMALAACAAQTPPPLAPIAATKTVVVAQAPPPASPFPKARYQPWGVDLTTLDEAVKPGDDFWAFVNGSWDKRTVIDPQRTYAGIDSVLNDQLDKDVRAIIEDMARNPSASGRKSQQIGDFYASWMDEERIEALGTKPLDPFLARIDRASDRAELSRLFATTGFAGPVGFGIFPDLKDPNRNALYAGQAGLGLPGRDYYLLEGAKYDTYRAAYRAYIERILTLAGIADAGARATRILALETRIAKSQWTPEQQRDPVKTYNPKSLAQLRAYAPQFDWDAMLAALKLPTAPTVLGEDTAIKAAGKIFAETPVQTYKDYLAFHFVSDHAENLPRAFDQARFDFYSKSLRDVPTKRDRWRRGVDLVNGALGEAVGEIFVERHYPPESSRQMGELITNIRAALAEKIATSDWMDAKTRDEARAKLDAFDPRTGHPTKYIDYSSLEVNRGDLFGNAIRSGQFDWDLLVSRYPQPVDRTLWGMLPQTNNAYYDSTTNQITFPAGILQAPYFDPGADPAANYGSIGATIGHEIGHGFDDSGRQFDGKGVLRDWWTAETAKKYTEQADRLVAQYNGYEPLPGTRIKGQLTLGENLGDLGGLEIAYAAYRRYVADHGEPPVIGGLTGDQRFFVAYGYSWQTKYRDGALRSRLLTDPHSPAKYRVNGVVRNMEAWYRAFGVQPGDAL
ncbi:MAG: M13 family metallopeptidase, partial [Sphingomicrobium sp.]